jgi:hypothetical protein
MITVDCPHCRMRLAISWSGAREIAEIYAKQEALGYSTPPLEDPSVEVKGEISEDDTNLLESLGIRP